MEKLKIRKLEANELSMLLQLHEYKDIVDMLSSNEAKINNGTIDIFGLFIENQIIGELRVKYVSEDDLEAICGRRVYLYAFRLLEEFQGKGYGTFLLNGVIDVLAKSGYSEFTVGVEDDNDRAIYMYQKAGFDTVIARKRECYQGDSYEYNLYLKEVR